MRHYFEIRFRGVIESPREENLKEINKAVADSFDIDALHGVDVQEMDISTHLDMDSRTEKDASTQQE